MKKIILFSLLAIGIVASAQVAKKVLPLDFAKGWFDSYTGLASDTLNTATSTTWSYEIPVNKFDAIYYVGKIKVSDKTTGANGVCTVKLQGKYFDADAYTDITTVQWTGINSSDSTIQFVSTTNKSHYSFLRYLVTNTAGKSKVDYVKTIIKR